MLFVKNREIEKQGYLFNPFRGLSKEEFKKAFPPDEEIKKALTGSYDILQIVGSCGYGKTSMISQIYCFLEKLELSPVYYYIKNGEDLPDFSFFSPQWILLDEAQRIRRKYFILQAIIWRQAGIRIILGSHMDHTLWFDEKFQVKTIYLKREMESRLENIIKSNLSYAAVGKTRHEFMPEAIKALCQCSEGSLETARAICYEVFLNPDLPEVISANLVIENAKRVMKKRSIIIKDF